jgi:hypothetical protein
MIASKSKVAPLKPVTVPRLELMGAILDLRLTQNISRVLEIPVPMQSVMFFSDSKDVLWWIRGRGRDFRSFVANRVGEIQMATEPCQWQYVLTDKNRQIFAREVQRHPSLRIVRFGGMVLYGY